MAKPKSSSIKRTPDIASFAGVLIGIGAILGGLVLEGGSVHDVAQITAAIIVLGGTLGAVMLTTPLRTLIGAIGRLTFIFFDTTVSANALVDQIVELATKARKSGIISLEADAETVDDPFLKKALLLAVDGTEMHEIRRMLEVEMEVEEQQIEAEAKVYEVAGGFSPTIGIIGAVLGLIQVMKNLANIDEVGHGIAVAFVATVYGVAAANLFFLPAAGKIRARVRKTLLLRELIIEGLTGIVSGMNPKLIRGKLEAFTLEEAPRKGGASAKQAPAGARAVSAEG